jgi:hypothetical protein
MSETPNLFHLGQSYFAQFIAEFASYGVEADPGLELREGTGLLCYYSLKDRQIYLAAPDLAKPAGKLQALFLRSLLGCQSTEELLYFFRLFLPRVIAHELTHHFRHKYGKFGDSLWAEEQIANKMAVAVTKHRLSPAQKTEARQFLQRAIANLSGQIDQKNIATDSYYSVLHALNVTGEINVADFENIELVESTLGVPAEQFLGQSGLISAGEVARLAGRDDLIEQVDEQYASDQIRYIYYHLGWMYLDLTSRETEYVDEFARNYLGLGGYLLPAIPPAENPSDRALQACFLAAQRSRPVSAVLNRYFYKRYRSLLLARLQTVDLTIAGQAEKLKREARLILESWDGRPSDTLDYLAALAPPELRRYFPQEIAAQMADSLALPADLPTETDRRLWQHALENQADESAAHTLYRLQILDSTDIYRPVPAEQLLELAGKLSLVHFAPGETVIWQNEFNDDVYFLIDGQLEVLLEQNGRETATGHINPGQMFGEIAFFTEDPRYATVRAVVPSHCFVLTDTDLQVMAYDHPNILMRMAAALAKRLADVYHTSRNETI